MTGDGISKDIIVLYWAPESTAEALHKQGYQVVNFSYGAGLYFAYGASWWVWNQPVNTIYDGWTPGVLNRNTADTYQYNYVATEKTDPSNLLGATFAVWTDYAFTQSVSGDTIITGNSNDVVEKIQVVGDRCWENASTASYTTWKSGLTTAPGGINVSTYAIDGTVLPAASGITAASQVKILVEDANTGVSVAVKGEKGQTGSLTVDKLETSPNADAITAAGAEKSVSYNVTPAVDGKAYTGEGTVTLPVPEDWATEASRIRAYIIDNDAVKLISGTLSGGKYTFQVPHFSEMGLVQLAKGAPSKTENITLTVGGTKTVSVDGIQEIVTAPNGQYATATTTTIPAEPVSYMATASASIGAYESYNSSNLIDGSASTFYWSKSAQTVGAYAQVDLGVAIPFDTVRITSPSNVGDDYCVNAAVQVSVDGSKWTDIGSYTGNKAAAQSFANTLGSARYIRVLIKNARGNWWKLAEIEWGNTQNGQFTRMAASGTVTVPERTSISFTGVAVGNTTAVIGDTQYNITVNGRVEIPITIIDYRADGLLFDWSYYPKNQGGQYYNSYRYGLVHSYAYDWGTGNGNGVDAYTNADGNLEVSGTANGVEKIEGTLIQRTGNANSSTKFFPNGTDNDWSRAGLVETNLGTNGMPVYTDAAVKYVASLLKAGYYNEMSGNCNSLIYDTFVAFNGSRTIRNTSANGFSDNFRNAKTYANISNAYDLAWYLLNTIYQADTNMTTVIGTDKKEHSVPIYGMAVDAYKSIVLTDNGTGTYSFEAGYSGTKKDVRYDQESGTIYNGTNGGDESGFYPLENLGYEQPGLLTATSKVNNGAKNGGFTLRGESQFVYNEASKLYFTFTGDDDVYMYINGVLALDLGGAHGRNNKTVNLNDLDPTKYGLKEGQVATFTFFYMERCSDASTFGIETNMELVQRAINVEKKAYDTSYGAEYADGASISTTMYNPTTVAYDLILTNKGNTDMHQISFTDQDTQGGTAAFGYGVANPYVNDSNTATVTLGELSTYLIYVTDGNNVVESTRKTLTTLNELSEEVGEVTLAPGQSLHVRFLTATFKVPNATIQDYTNTVHATAYTKGETQPLKDDASHELYSYNANDTGRTYVVDFGLPLEIHSIFDATAQNNIGDVSYNPGKNNLKYGTVVVKPDRYNTTLTYTRTADKTIDGAETIVLDVQYTMGSNKVTLEKTLTIIPASNVYYEDSLATFTPGTGAAKDAQWSIVGKATDEQKSATQALEELHKKKNVYGYDDAYNSSSMLSMGTAHKVTVTAAMLAKWDDTTSAWPTAQFTFKGTGFDIISLTNNKSGAIFVDVYKAGEEKPTYSYIVDNYYGYNYNKDTGKWEVVNSSTENALYQIPVMKVTGLDYGEYNAVVTVFYDGLFNHTGDTQYSFWLDAVRIYDPMGEYADYTKDNEGYPQYIKLRDTLAKSTIGTTLFIDGKEDATIAEYANYGPNNEVYLMDGQAITFKIPQNAKVDSIQIGAKAPNGTANMTVTGANMTSSPATETLSTATEMYYKINVNVSTADQTVVIANKGGNGILSLTNLKITYKSEPAEGEKVTLSALDNPEQENAVNLVRALFTAPVATFSPETFEADWGRAVRAGKRATLTVKTSADVESITVDGQAITSYTTRTQRTGWGWWSPKVTYHVFTYTITAPAQTTDYAVCAVNAEGTASEAVTATLTVRPATWWNWWF